MGNIIDKDGVTEYLTHQSPLTAVEEDKALQDAARIPELEGAISALQGQLGKTTADLVYDFNLLEFADDGTRFFRNKSLLNKGKFNGSVTSGNPLDFQGSQSIKTEQNINLTGQKASFVYRYTPSSASNQYTIDFGLSPLIWNSGSAHRVYNQGINYPSKSLPLNVPITVAVIINEGTCEVYYDGVKEFTHEIGDIKTTTPVVIGSSSGQTTAFSDCQMEYVVIVDNAITESEVKRFMYEPEKAVMEYGTNPALKGVFVTDFSGFDKYVSNVCEFSAVDQPFTRAMSSIPASQGSIVTRPDGTFDIELLSNTSFSYSPYVHYYLTDIQPEDIFYYEFHLEVTGNTPVYLRGIEAVPSPFSNKELVRGKHVVSGVGKSTKTSAGTRKITLLVNGKDYPVPSTLKCTKVVIKKLSGVEVIKNYSETQRTNFSSQPKGYQHFVVDKVNGGFSNGFLDKSMLSSKSTDQILIGDGGLALDENFTIEAVYNFRNPFGYQKLFHVEGSVGITNYTLGSIYSYSRDDGRTASHDYAFTITSPVLEPNKTIVYTLVQENVGGRVRKAVFVDGKKKNDITKFFIDVAPTLITKMNYFAGEADGDYETKEVILTSSAKSDEEIITSQKALLLKYNI